MQNLREGLSMQVKEGAALHKMPGGSGFYPAFHSQMHGARRHHSTPRRTQSANWEATVAGRRRRPQQQQGHSATNSMDLTILEDQEQVGRQQQRHSCTSNGCMVTPSVVPAAAAEQAVAEYEISGSQEADVSSSSGSGRRDQLLDAAAAKKRAAWMQAGAIPQYSESADCHDLALIAAASPAAVTAGDGSSGKHSFGAGSGDSSAEGTSGANEDLFSCCSRSCSMSSSSSSTGSFVSCLGLNEGALGALISCTDSNRNGEIDWGEFVVATLDPGKLAEEDNIRQVFEVRLGSVTYEWKG